MRTQLIAVAAVVLSIGITVGCERSVPGTVAMTTEPGAPITTPKAMPNFPSFTLAPFPSFFPTPTSGASPTATVPAPPNALTMTCKEFGGLDDATRKAVVQAILAQEKDSPFGMLGGDFAASMATTVCQFLPESTVKEVLVGTTVH